MIIGIDHVEVVTDDMDASIEFYTNTLGFTLVRRIQYSNPSPGRLREIAYVLMGETAVELLAYPADTESGATPLVGVKMIALRVDDMEKTLEALRLRGIEASRPPINANAFDGLRAEITDPQGVSFELREWRDGDSPSNPAWQPNRPEVSRIS